MLGGRATYLLQLSWGEFGLATRKMMSSMSVIFARPSTRGLARVLTRDICFARVIVWTAAFMLVFEEQSNVPNDACSQNERFARD